MAQHMPSVPDTSLKLPIAFRSLFWYIFLRNRYNYILLSRPRASTCIIHRWCCHASIRNQNKRCKKSHKNHVFFSVLSKLSNSGPWNFNFAHELARAIGKRFGEHVSHKEQELVLFSIYHRTFSFSSHWSHHLLLFVHPSSFNTAFLIASEEAIQNTSMHTWRRGKCFPFIPSHPDSG